MVSSYQFRCAPSQWETSLHCNDVSHWLGAYLDWSLVSRFGVSCLVRWNTAISWQPRTNGELVGFSTIYPKRYTYFLRFGVFHDDVIEWKHFPRYWPLVRGIHRSPVNSPHKGQWRGALMFSLICVWINGWVNNGDAGDLRRYRVHYSVIVILWWLHASLFYPYPPVPLLSHCSNPSVITEPQNSTIPGYI